MRVSFTYLALSLAALGCCSAYSSCGQPLENRLTKLGLKNESLDVFFTKLKEETGLSFVFPGKVYEYANISLPKNKRSVKEALDLVLGETNLSYRYKDNTVFIYEIIDEDENEETRTEVDEVFLYAAAISTVTGKVIDATNSEPMAGVNVFVKNTTRGTATDADGAFTIEAKDHEVLIFSFIGFKTIEEPVNGRTTIEVLMESDVTSLKAVEIIGTTYYSTTREKSTMNIAKVTAKEIEKQPVTNPLMALQGRMPGVDITPYNGVAGGAIKIRVRGNNSLRPSGGYPLYIIDGVPIESQPIQSGSGNLLSFGIDPLSSLDPSNIESIEVLKDGAATSIYGARGANGVVRITTKRAQGIARTNFDFTFYSGFGEMPTKLELLNTEQYLAMRNEAFANDGVFTPQEWAFDINGTWDNTRYTDWQETLLGGRASINDIHGSLSGGNGQTSFRLGGGFHKENTIYPGDFGYSNITGNLSVDHASENQKLRANVAVNYGSNRNKVFDNSNYVTLAISLPPNAPPIYDANGELNGQYSYTVGPVPVATWDNPFALLRNTHEFKMDNLIANGVLSYEILPGLSCKTNLGLTDMHSNELLKFPLTASTQQSLIRPGDAGNAKFGVNSRSSWIVEPQLTYMKNFSDHAFDIVIGTSWQESRRKYQSIAATGYSSDVLLNSLLAAPTTRFDTYEEIHYRYSAFFGRIGYSWKDRYLLDISGRRDGSSRFGPGNRFANFAGASAGWIFSKDPFFTENIRLISFGKIRSSYATTGSDQISDYGYLNTYGIAANRYQGFTSFYPTALYNPSFAWEETRKLEIALELGLLEDRIRMETSWFRNRSSNQLVNAPLPSTTGFNSVLSNLDAVIENSGWEFMLNTVNIIRPEFKWNASINLTIPKNKLVRFDNIEDSQYATRYKVGEPLSIQRLYTWLGVNPQTGLHEVLDVNRDGIYDDDDKKFSEPIGRKYFGGILNTLTYKEFELSFLFQFCDQTSRRYSPSLPGAYGNVPTQVLARWRGEGDVTNYQKFSTIVSSHDAGNRAKESDYDVVDGSFIRLKTLALSYSLSGLPIRKIALQDAKIFAQAQNLFVITDFVGLDPEIGHGAMPPLRMVTMGIQIKF